MTHFKTGDRVITNRFEKGNECIWIPSMGKFVGKKGLIEYNDQGLKDYLVHGHLWPASALTLVPELKYGDECEVTESEDYWGIDLKFIYLFPDPANRGHWVTKPCSQDAKLWAYVRPIKRTPREELKQSLTDSLFDRGHRINKQDIETLLQAIDHYVTTLIGEQKCELLWPTFEEVRDACDEIHHSSYYRALGFLGTKKGQSWLRQRRQTNNQK